MERTNEAIDIFKKIHGKTPQELGFPIIDIYERQCVFLYAVSAEVIKAYKAQQNILHWMILWYMWPLVIVMINFFEALIRYQDIWHQRCIISYIFVILWFLLAIVLGIKVYRTTQLIKFNKSIIILIYEQ